MRARCPFPYIFSSAQVSHAGTVYISSDNGHPQNAQFPHILTPSKRDSKLQEQQTVVEILEQSHTRTGKALCAAAQELLPCVVRPYEFAAGDGAGFIY